MKTTPLSLKERYMKVFSSDHTEEEKVRLADEFTSLGNLNLANETDQPQGLLRGIIALVMESENRVNENEKGK